MTSNRDSNVTYAIPSPIRELAPWKTLTGTEANAVRLVYDSFLAARPDNELPDLGIIESEGEAHILRPGLSRYADGVPATLTCWHKSLESALKAHYPDALIALDKSRIVVNGLARHVLTDFLRSSAGIAFRGPAPGLKALDSHPNTSGQFQISVATDRELTLRRNAFHVRQPTMESIRIVQITKPSDLHDGFASGHLDIIVVGGDENAILRREDRRLRNGELYKGHANAISFLSARPGGALADDELRQAIARAVPRQEFQEKYIRDSGRAVFGMCPDSRDRAQSSLATEPRISKRVRQLVFIVPPSERTVARAQWLASTMGKRLGIQIEVEAPPWRRYWHELRSPDGGDLLWTGISVENDVPREWVRDNLFGRSLPIPASFDALRHRLWSQEVTDEDLVDAERIIVDSGWVVPLYQHYHTYLVRRGLTGMRLDAADWPLPGIHYAGDLEWD